MFRSELKRKARLAIRNNIGTLFLICLLVGGLCYGIGLIPLVGWIVGTLFLSPAFSISLTAIYLDLSNGGYASLDDGFGMASHWWISLKTSFLTNIFRLLWSLLLVIPGIIKSYSYMLTPYIIAEAPETNALDAIYTSRRMMNGHKTEAFFLNLSFIGWFLLGIFTCFIAFIWIGPYYQATMTEFYKYVRDDYYKKQNSALE